MTEFLQELKDAVLSGFYVPELEVVYLSGDYFNIPRVLALDLGH